MNALSGSLNCNLTDTLDTFDTFYVFDNACGLTIFENELQNQKEASESLTSPMKFINDEPKEDTKVEDVSKGKESGEGLKRFPSNLRYELLGPNEYLPVIIEASLGEVETSKLMHVLKLHKIAIGF